ncbi:hypothetical protein HAX54_041789, partial [Datura stramonium]|nr:hypothetical protein [Datura stramonium]
IAASSVEFGKSGYMVLFCGGVEVVEEGGSLRLRLGSESERIGNMRWWIDGCSHEWLGMNGISLVSGYIKGLRYDGISQAGVIVGWEKKLLGFITLVVKSVQHHGKCQVVAELGIEVVVGCKDSLSELSINDGNGVWGVILLLDT